MHDGADPCSRLIGHWEERFAEDAETYFFGKEPSALGRLALRFWKLCRGDDTARILDLGCGEGRDAAWFAEQGHRVTAVEPAPSGLAKAHRLAEERGARLETGLCCDMLEVDLAGYDLYFAGNSLNLLGRSCLPFLRRLRAATPRGGLHAVRIATRESWGPDPRPGHYRFDHNELKHEYRGWRLLYYGEDLIYVPHLDRLASFADIIAQKTRGAAREPD
ncbi:MAG: methyltransferase domain-containing protein [Chthonomonadales bacterium]|nr:methyltransferase domain-containing protein [Chthonomonadales bacterium]